MAIGGPEFLGILRFAAFADLIQRNVNKE